MKVKKIILIFLCLLNLNFNSIQGNNKNGEEFIKNVKENGGKLYYNYNKVTLEGIKEFKGNSIPKKVKLYAISKNKEEINFNICTNIKKFDYEAFYYYREKDYYIGTIISKEEDLNVFHRLVTKIYKDKKIEFNYMIINQCENLNSIKFNYLNGTTKSFSNSLNMIYYDHTKISNEKDVPKEFKKE